MELTVPIPIDQYSYELPSERIAQYPLPERDQCRLLVADCQREEIRHHIFAELPGLLPARSLLVRNVTKVVPARLFLRKPTGGRVEVLLLRPVQGLPEEGFAAHPPVEWWGLVRGHRLRPQMELVATAGERVLRVHLYELLSGLARLMVSWEPGTETMAEMLHAFGQIPLPPYLRRKAESSDWEHYQTVYALVPSSVAAPTAGLHFTERLLKALKHAGIAIADVCLHIGMDTFKPVRVEDARQHQMQSESLSIPRQAVQVLENFLRMSDRGWLVAVGTTSVRSLESLYWHGVRLVRREPGVWDSSELLLSQWEAYCLLQKALPPTDEVFDALLQWMETHRIESIRGTTQLMIVPGYQYRLCDALITNFHQPRSTLLLLVGAFAGEFWRRIYAEALAQNYRFLSYGDASLLVYPVAARSGFTARLEFKQAEG